MRAFSRFAFVFSLLAGLLLLNGCAVYDVAVEERNPGQWAEDKKTSAIIEERFLEDELVEYLHFDAYTYLGHVYVVGEYTSREQVDRAVEIAKDVKGVREVTTYLLPKRDDPTCGTAGNMNISAKLKKALVNDSTIWSTNIDYEVLQCRVVLLGIVGTDEAKAAAEAHAASVPGVRGIKSFITVNR